MNPVRPVVSPATPSAPGKDLDDDDDKTTASASPTIKPSDLNLTPQQTQTIIDIRRNSTLEAEKTLKVELKNARHDLNQAMCCYQIPGDEVRKKFELVQKKNAELQRLKFERTLKIRDVLTPDQRKKFQSTAK